MPWTYFYDPFNAKNEVRQRRSPYLKLAGFFEFLHVTLTLQGTSGSKEDIFRVAVDILLPVGEPSDSIIINDLAPFARHVRSRNRRALPNIESDVTRMQSILPEDVSPASLTIK